MIKEDTGKHGYALQGVNISEEQHSGNEDLGIFLVTINSRDIRFNSVSSDVLVVVLFKATFGNLKCLRRTVL